MFSASLLSMMVHSLPPDAKPAFLEGELTPKSPFPTFTYPTSRHLAAKLEHARKNWTGEWPMLPVVGRLDRDLVGRAENMTKHQTSSDPERGFVWGRIPLDDLIKHYFATSEDPPDKEYIDLGTPVRSLSITGGSNSKITNLLAQTPSPSAASVGAALVDLGKAPTAAPTNVPQDFGGKLRHVTYPPGTSIDLSPHAEKVLEVLLDRLTAKNMLTSTTISMALINNPNPDQIRSTMDCFEQHCAPEMLQAVQAINNLLDADFLSDGSLMPAVVNMSVGTHVGPHNGQSPLEAYISGSVYKPTLRFPFAAAGNEGSQRLSSTLALKQGEADYMDFAATDNCTELLIEFWWAEAIGPAGMEILVEIQAHGMHNTAIPITSGFTGPKLLASAVGQRPPVTFFTLCQSHAHGNMSCIAFAATRPAPPPGTAPLPDLLFSFTIKAKSSNVVIHSWTVICDKNQKSHFTHAGGGGPEGTVSAPASDPKVISVAAFDPATGDMWRSSSRGPASRYDPNAPIESPKMAHLSNHPTAPNGTSFASPRAAADATEPLANSSIRANCTDPRKLIEQTYGMTATTCDPRYGFHKQTV